MLVIMWIVVNCRVREGGILNRYAIMLKYISDLILCHLAAVFRLSVGLEPILFLLPGRDQSFQP